MALSQFKNLHSSCKEYRSENLKYLLLLLSFSSSSSSFPQLWPTSAKNILDPLPYSQPSSSSFTHLHIPNVHPVERGKNLSFFLRSAQNAAFQPLLSIAIFNWRTSLSANESLAPRGFASWYFAISLSMVDIRGRTPPRMYLKRR